VGLGVKTTFQIISEANQYRNTLTKTDHGALEVLRLPCGIYQLEVVQTGFARASEDHRDSFFDCHRILASNRSCGR
jgi:hypothetical protein